MRNFIFFLVIFIIIIIGLAPGVDGYLFKRNYFRLIDIINKREKAKIDVLVYKEGWLNSYAKIRVTPAVFVGDPNAPNLVLENFISHGPILHDTVNGGLALGYATIKTLINFSDSSKRYYDERQNPETGIEINTLAKFSGKWFNKLKLNQLVISKPYLGKLSWDGLDGNVNFTLHGNTIKYISGVLKFGALFVEADVDNPYFKQFTIQALTYEKTAERMANTLWSGQTKMTIPNITITLANATNIVVNQLALESSTGKGINESAYSLNSQFTLKSLEVPSGLGLIPSLSDILFKFNMENLNAEATKNLLKHFRALQSKSLTNEDLAKYWAFAAQTITKTTTVNQSLDFNCSLGAFKNDSKLTWPAPVTFKDASDFFKKATIAVNVRMSIPLAYKLIAAYFENIDVHEEPKALQPAPTREMVSAAKENFNQTVGLLFQQNKITMPISMQIIGMADQHLSLDAFTTSMKALGLPPEAVSQLQVAYQQYQAQLAKIATAPNPEQAEAQKLAMQRQAQAAMVKNLIDNLISQGFIKIENNNYVSAVLYQNDHITVNGKPFTTDMINPGPVNIGPALPPTNQTQPVTSTSPQAVQPEPVQPAPQPGQPSPQSVRPVITQPVQPASPQAVQPVPTPIQPAQPPTQQHLAP